MRPCIRGQSMKVRNGISRLRSFRKNELAASSSEYALILCVVGVGVGAASLALGANVGSSMNGKVNDFDPTFVAPTKGSGGGGGGGGNASPSPSPSPAPAPAPSPSPSPTPSPSPGGGNGNGTRTGTGTETRAAAITAEVRRSKSLPFAQGPESVGPESLFRTDRLWMMAARRSAREQRIMGASIRADYRLQARRSDHSGCRLNAAST